MTALDAIIGKPAPFRTKSLLATRMLVMLAKRYRVGETEMSYRHFENNNKY